MATSTFYTVSVLKQPPSQTVKGLFSRVQHLLHFVTLVLLFEIGTQTSSLFIRKYQSLCCKKWSWPSKVLWNLFSSAGPSKTTQFNRNTFEDKMQLGNIGKNLCLSRLSFQGHMGRTAYEYKMFYTLTAGKHWLKLTENMWRVSGSVRGQVLCPQTKSRSCQEQS